MASVHGVLVLNSTPEPQSIDINWPLQLADSVGAAKKDAAEVQAAAVRQDAEVHANGAATAASKLAAATGLAAEAKFTLGKQKLQLEVAIEQARMHRAQANMNWEQLMTFDQGSRCKPNPSVLQTPIHFQVVRCSLAMS